MLTTNNNILFDDLATISSAQLSGNSADNSIMYGDCGNRFEIETSVNENLDCVDNQMDS
ncbi:hypothetical protein BDD43_2149 [Mucilaginibacter gracilis]|uniref:Uncharacterized protein n=1 Tax=Mucilaginibacter gracilis TaxID=423350 RepID=A0A495IZ43_9SPHI|nr:hypothetical protein [Mucilaginibacter gracilis]RKR81986.1 hypothetical protein BDD43_2149 [Mucilaginibacter gracilis]